MQQSEQYCCTLFTLPEVAKCCACSNDIHVHNILDDVALQITQQTHNKPGIISLYNPVISIVLKLVI